MATLSSQRLSLHERMENIEKQNRQLKRSMAFLVLALLFGFFLIGATKGLQDGNFRQVTAEKIAIIDSSGHEQIIIGSENDRTGIRILNKDGKRVLGLGVTDKGESGILVADAQGRPRIGLGMDEGVPGVALVNEQGKKILALGGDETGYGFVVMDENERQRAGLGYKQGFTGIMIFDDQGQYVRGMVREADGRHYFSYADENGKEVIAK